MDMPRQGGPRHARPNDRHKWTMGWVWRGAEAAVVPPWVGGGGGNVKGHSKGGGNRQAGVGGMGGALEAVVSSPTRRP